MVCIVMITMGFPWLSFILFERNGFHARTKRKVLMKELHSLGPLDCCFLINLDALRKF